MFKSSKLVAYQSPDLEASKQWYRKLLKMDPAFESPLFVLFNVGDSGLILVPARAPVSKDNESIVAYWDVDDVEAAYRQLLEAGATPHAEISTVLNSKIAQVVDPFGNILGITATIPDTEKETLEDRPSDSAMTVAFCRAFATKDERKELRGPDYLAEIFLTENREKFLEDPAAREWVMKNLFIPGMYEYFIARTAYFDHIVEQALRENIPQIVFLGAGYDTRSYRFSHLIQKTRLFELDMGPTQQRKRRLLRQAGIPMPEQLTLVPINFNRDALATVLVKAGFNRNKKALFIWEGVTYYLPAQAVDVTLNTIRSNSPAGSVVCFDYMAHAPDMESRYGVKKARESMQSMNAVERIQFLIEEGTIASFLAERGYKMLDHLTTEEIERKYLTLNNGSLAAKIVALFCLVQAAVM